MLFQFLTDRFFYEGHHRTNKQLTNLDSTRRSFKITDTQYDPLRFSVSQSEFKMGDSEKLIALKKAYAEIILNSAKEAAERVMVAEKKAFRYQREVVDVKEDALRMMLRLKQMMDSKILEADITASHQQCKIDELEAQLHEAEDIVKDLRDELALVRDELDYMRKNRLLQKSDQQADHVVIQGQEPQVEQIAPSISGFNHSQILKVQQAIHTVESELGGLSDQRTNGSKYYDQSETLHAGSLEMARKVTLTKELEFFKNGSSQKTNELTNENLNDGVGIHGKSLSVKDDSIVREDCENSGKFVAQASSAEVYVSERKSHNRIKQVKKSNKPFYLAVNIKARYLRFKKSNNPSSLRIRRRLANKILKSLQKTRLSTSKADPYPVVSSAVKETNSLKNSALPLKTVDLCFKAGLHGGIQPCSHSTPENDKSKIVESSTGEENGSAESSVTCADPDISCVPSRSINEEPDELDADGAFQPKIDKSIKFTFQRKRKKECMSSADENNTVKVKKTSDEQTLVRSTKVEFDSNGSSHSSESKENTLKELKRSLKRMKVDNQDFKTSTKLVDVEKPTDTKSKAIGIVPKATRDSRRLAQVARQLLSMSEKKWWD